MAKFDEIAPDLSREDEKVVPRKKPVQKAKNKLSEEDKRKYIGYGIIGFITLLLALYIINDFGTDENNSIQDMETPESESDKYNTKLQAIEQNEKPSTTTGNLEDAYKMSAAEENDSIQSESANRLQLQLDQLENEQNQKKVVVSNQSSNNQQSVTRKSSGGTTYPKENQESKNSRPAEKELIRGESKSQNQNNGSSFFKTKTTSKGNTSNVLLYASIHTDQIIKEGSRVKLRLTKNTVIGNDTFLINTIVYGIAKIQPNRLMVEINKINQVNVKLEIYDAEDSNAGIYVETPHLNALVRKEFKKDALDETDISAIPFSKTLKNLFAKKAKEESIELLNNYKIIIKQKRENEN